MKTYYVYIMSNISRTTLYIGVTNNLERRVAEHRTCATPGYTAKYRCTDLLYYEDTPSITAAIDREKQLKKWSRKKKEALVQQYNHGLIDLSASSR